MNEAPTSRNLAGAAGAIGVATMMSRILGVAREMVLAGYFGAGLYTDAFNIAYRIPNLLRDLFAEGALSSAFVPTFVRQLTHDGRESAWSLANKVINALVVILCMTTLLLVFGAKWFVYLLASGYAEIPEKFALTVQMTRIMSPFLLWIALAAVAMGMLNACGSFFVPAMASSAFNLCCILAGIFLSPLMPRWGMAPVVSMAIGALVGGMSQLFVQVPSAYRIGFRYRFVLDFKDPALRHIAMLMLPAVIGLSATQINITVDSQLASHFGNGPVSWLNYAYRLMQLPVGVFGIAIATVTLSAVSHHAAQKDLARLRETVLSSLRLAACLTFPATVGLILFREPIVRLLYERHAFLPGDTTQTARALLFYALALFSYSGVKIIVPAFYALNDTRTPVRISVITVALKVAINLLLVIPLGFLGLALATAVASWFNLVLLLRALGRRSAPLFHRHEGLVYLKIVIASLLMGMFAGLSFRMLGMLFPAVHSSTALGLELCGAIAAGTALIVPLLRLLRIEDAEQLLALIRNR